ncbi:MAG: U32 family peptidase [Thermodesulfobacteriota bacterium]|nr:MAG: U32 family peptidase [Thermodesulfobacteriota bacterium]
MELTIGPVLFEWKRDEIIRFYREVEQMDVDRVYIGEVVCTKKRALRLDDVAAIKEGLEKAGKKVTLSSLAVVSNDEELDFTRSLVSLSSSVEANDMSVLNIADPAATEVFAGPHITTYNVPSLEFLSSVGVTRAAFPVELSRDAIAYNIENTGVFAEVFAHGKVPLAFSWRCYTSRAYGRSKAECRHDCANFPDGMELKNVDGVPLFTAAGTTLLSADTYTLVELVEDLRAVGVGALRVSPQFKGTAKVAAVFRRRIDGLIGPAEGLSEFAASGERFCNGWYMGGAGKDYVSAPSGGGQV